MDRWTETAVRRDEMFTVNEVEAILRRALHRKRDSGEITRDELVETARELGLDPREVERAIQEQRKFGEIDSAREEFKQKQKVEFYNHLRSYLIVNGALILLDLLVSRGTWFFYPMVFWGIGLAFHASHAFNPCEREIERGARKILRKRQRRQFEMDSY